ncbi:MAG: HAD hydrolase-like protein [Patescibacteria group bacterium]
MKLLIFDFDGVIIDSFGILYQSALEAYPDIGSEEDFRRLHEGNIYQTVTERENQNAITIEHPLFARYIPRMLELPPVLGMVELVRELTDILPAIVVSSCLNDPIKVYCNKYGLAGLFREFYGADIEKSKVYKMRTALKAFGLESSEAVIITDTLGDLREAVIVGVPSIAVTWGFHTAETLRRGSPAHFAFSVEELKKILLNLATGRLPMTAAISR